MPLEESKIINTNPLVSIGLPTYNRPLSLKRALDSLLSQTYKNIEINIGDNSENSESEKVFKEYSSDTRIKYHKHEKMLEGSSIDENIVNKVREYAKDFHSIMVCLDSNHTHDHVLQELELYANLVSIGNYCIVWDTVVEDMPEGSCNDRPWGKGNNPKTAVWEFLKTHSEFEIDKNIQNKLLITVAPYGYLRRVRK